MSQPEKKRRLLPHAPPLSVVVDHDDLVLTDDDLSPDDGQSTPRLCAEPTKAVALRRRTPRFRVRETPDERRLRSVVDFCVLENDVSASERPGHTELVARVLAAHCATFQPFAAETLWPGVSAAPWAEFNELWSEWQPWDVPSATLHIPPLQCVPLISPEAVAFFDDGPQQCLLLHAVADGRTPEDAALLPVLRDAAAKPRSSSDVIPSAAPVPASRPDAGLDPDVFQVLAELCAPRFLPNRLALTLRLRATVLRARFQLTDDALASLGAQRLWKAFLVNDRWVANVLQERHARGCAVDRPELAAVRNVCRLLGMPCSVSPAAGVPAKRLDPLPRTPQDVARLGVQPRNPVTVITKAIVLRSVCAALLRWSGTTVEIRRGQPTRVQLLDFRNEWFENALHDGLL